MWKNIVERGRTQMTILHMCIACWIPKAANTHSQYVILIATPLQQWLQEHASMLIRHSLFCICLALLIAALLVIVIRGLFWELDPRCYYFPLPSVLCSEPSHVSWNKPIFCFSLCPCTRHDATWTQDSNTVLFSPPKISVQTPNK